MKRIFILLATLFSFSFTLHNDKPAYLLFTGEGKSTSYEKLLKRAQSADVILFGEQHNNPVSHWLQFELTKDLHKEVGNKLVLGAEMFEADNQLILNEYLKGVISGRNFNNEMRLWSNYETDYKPLVEFAKEQQLEFIATNIPRRYASLVYHQGFEALDTLSDEAKKWIAPLPVKYDPELASYKNMFEVTGMHGGENLPKSQAIKDATMAHFILKNREKETTFLHLNGAYHSNDYEGIAWYLKENAPKLKLITISTVEQENIGKLKEENHQKADFIICTPTSMTKTH